MITEHGGGIIIGISPFGAPIWVKEHIDALLKEFYESERLILAEISASSGTLRETYEKELQELRINQKEEIHTELANLERFYEILATTDKTYREAENEVYHNRRFYVAYERKLNWKEKKHISAKKKIVEEKKEDSPGFYLEKDLSKAEKDDLLIRVSRGSKSVRLEMAVLRSTG